VRRHPVWTVGGLVALGVLAGAVSAQRLPWLGGKPVPEDGAGSHWEQAQEALEAQDFPRARIHLSHCLETWPVNAEAHFLMARSCRRADDGAGWQRHLKNAEILQWPKEALALERRLMQAQVGDVRGAEPALVGYLERQHPDELLIYEALAKGALEADRLHDVLHWTTAWLERHPDAWQPRLYRGRCFHLGRSLHRAIAEYRRVLEARPDQVQVRLWLAGSLMLDGQFADALAEFQHYLQSRGDDPAALLGAANCQLSLNQPEAARAALDQLLARQPQHAGGFLLRAKLELEKGSAEEALSWLKRAETLAPHETDITHTLSLTLRRLGRHDEAQKYEHKLHDLRRRYEALDLLQQRILKETENASLRSEAGLLCLSLGRDGEAMRWLRSALQLDPGHRATHQALADYYEKSGDRSRAEYHRQKASADGSR
jgi:tetratricopeptide (TPR) repeat protein